MLAVAGGCREKNPEWLGPRSDATTEPGATTSTTDGSSSSTSEDDASSSTGRGTDTDGPIACNNDNQCPDGLLCGPVFCQGGVEGDECTRARHCADGLLCSSARVCQDGTLGDPCEGPGDCAAESTCENEVCT